jgi:hypothetical protein
MKDANSRFSALIQSSLLPGNKRKDSPSHNLKNIGPPRGGLFAEAFFFFFLGGASQAEGARDGACERSIKTSIIERWIKTSIMELSLSSIIRRRFRLPTFS